MQTIARPARGCGRKNAESPHALCCAANTNTASSNHECSPFAMQLLTIGLDCLTHVLLSTGDSFQDWKAQVAQGARDATGVVPASRDEVICVARCDKQPKSAPLSIVVTANPLRAGPFACFTISPFFQPCE
jgi:hypothetical protein